MLIKKTKHILWFKQISKKDVAKVGGKNASLGEMYSKLNEKGIRIPNGFAVSAKSYWYFLKHNKVEKELKELFINFNANNIKRLEIVGAKARSLIRQGEFPKDLEKAILKAHQELSEFYKQDNLVMAVRSSATAEDGVEASFAGQHESYLNVKGQEALLIRVKDCMASLFTNRAIAYRAENGFGQMEVALSVTVQKMIGSGQSSAGIMFTLDTETGFDNVILINSIFGVGEMIVKGKVTPDEFYVFKPTLPPVKIKNGFKPIIVKNLGRKNRKYVYSKSGGLEEVAVEKSQQLQFSITDEEILCLARWGKLIEDHYGRPQDIEWAKDAKTNELYIVQSRPETVQAMKDKNKYIEYKIKTNKKPILTGIAVGDKVGSGKIHKINDISKLSEFKRGEVLVTKMTDPDWVPVMRKASAIVTDEGGKTAHAAIVARELGVPAIVGTGSATSKLKNGELITVDCTEGLNGKIFEGRVKVESVEHNLKKIPKLPVDITVNIGAPDIAFRVAGLPSAGVGLAREEFIIAEKIRIHPLALYNYKKLEDKKLKDKIDKMTVEHKNKKEYFVKELAEGIGQIGAAFYPKPVIVRFSDFKTNEYRQLVGGELYEPEEANPMLGWRGASRYYHPKFKPAFIMECQAIRRVREVFGLKNIKVMVPFCRTPEEGEKVLEIMKQAGLEKGKDGLEVYVMAELPSNVVLADQFLKIFDGMSIGSNDLLQLTMGIDRDNGNLAQIANENSPAIQGAISQIIKACKAKNKYVGICGQGPSDLPEFAEFLLKEGIESISLNPDTIIKTILNLSKK